MGLYRHGRGETLQFSNGDGRSDRLTFPINGTAGNDTLTAQGCGYHQRPCRERYAQWRCGERYDHGGANDTLSGQGGNDTLRGEGGNDIYVYDGGQDKIYETGGTDVLKLASAMTVDALVFSNVGTVDTKMAFSAGNDVTLYGQRGTNAALKVETVQLRMASAPTSRITNPGSAGRRRLQTITGRRTPTPSWAAAGTIRSKAMAGTMRCTAVRATIRSKAAAATTSCMAGPGQTSSYGDAGNDTLYGDDGLDNLGRRRGRYLHVPEGHGVQEHRRH